LLIQLTSGHELVAPAILPFEIGNALVAMTKRGAIRPTEITAVWDAIRAVAVELRTIDIRAALDLAVRFGVYAYDAYFLECALSLRLPLLTLDKKMKRMAWKLDIRVLE